MTRLALVACLLLSIACGGGSDSTTDPPVTPPPTDPGPASVEVIGVSQGNGLVTVHLHNTGGPGVFKIEFYGLPTSPNGPETFFGATEPVEVDTAYDESPSYQVRDSPEDPPVTYLLVFTRDQGSATYRQTDRYDIP
jgi:hypothetical protein